MTQKRRSSVSSGKAGEMSRSREMSSASGKQQEYERRQRQVELEESRQRGRGKESQSASTESAKKAKVNRRATIEAGPEEESKTGGLRVKESSSSSAFIVGTPPGGRGHQDKDFKQRVLAARVTGVSRARRLGRRKDSASASDEQEAGGDQRQHVMRCPGDEDSVPHDWERSAVEEEVGAERIPTPAAGNAAVQEPAVRQQLAAEPLTPAPSRGEMTPQSQEEEEKAGGSEAESRSEVVAEPVSEKTIRKMYNLAHSWGYEDAAWNLESREAQTRSKQSKLGLRTAEQRGIRPGQGGLGYGETTLGSLEAMIKLFKQIASGTLELAASSRALKRQYLSVCKTITFDSGSTFLDIGSGLGKSVLHLVMASGCRGIGMEVVDNRFQLAGQFLQRLIDNAEVPTWVSDRITYLRADAAAAPHTPIVVNGEQPSHVFMFSRVFSEEDL